MSRRHHQPYARGGHEGWSVGSDGLTSSDQSELLKHLGYHLQNNYQSLLKEPAPDRIRQLLTKLETTRRPEEDEHL